MNLIRRPAALLLAVVLTVDVAVIGAAHRHQPGPSGAASCPLHRHAVQPGECSGDSHSHHHSRQTPCHDPTQEHDDDCAVCRHLMQQPLPAPAIVFLPAPGVVEQAAPPDVVSPPAPAISAGRPRAPPTAA